MISLPQLLSLLVHSAKQMLRDLFVDLLIDRLALWQELTVDNAEILRRLLHEARFEGVESIKKGRNDGAEGHP